MKTVSLDVLNAIDAGVLFYLELRIDYADGSHEYLSKEHFTFNDNSFTDGASLSTFPLGNAHAKQVTVSIINTDDRYKDVDFTNAIFTVNVCADIDGVKHEVSLGQHTVIEPESYGDIITVTAMDEMYKGDAEYRPGIEFPATIGNMFIDSCQQCGVIAVSDVFPNSDYVITEAPVGITHRALWSWCGLIAGGNARMNADNKLEIVSYNYDYSTAFPINNGFNLKTAADNVVITGIRLNAGDEVYESGVIGYVIDLETELSLSNPQDFVDRIGSLLIGASFRPLDVTIPANPLIEFGDRLVVTDRKGNKYYTIATDVEFNFFGTTTVKCVAENAIRNSSRYNSAAAAAYNKANTIIKKESDNFKDALAALALTADKKNSVFYQDETPPIIDRKVNDVWFKSSEGNKMYFWDGEAWSPQQFGSNALSANSVTAEKIVTNAVTTAALATQSVTAEKVNLLDLFAQNIVATGSITGATLLAAIIHSTKGMIGGFNIGESSIYSDRTYTNESGYDVNTQLEFSNGSGNEPPYISMLGTSDAITNILPTLVKLSVGGGKTRPAGVTAFDYLKLAFEYPENDAESYLKLSDEGAEIGGADFTIVTDSGTFMPYFKAGDRVSYTWRTAGYCHNSGKSVTFAVPLAKPVIGSPEVSVVSNSGFSLRQNGAYTHGTSATASNPEGTVFTAGLAGNSYVRITAEFPDATNALSNDSIGVYWSGIITFI